MANKHKTLKADRGSQLKRSVLEDSHLRRTLFHWGPIIALSIISLVSYSATICTLQWWPVHTLGGVINLVVFLFWVFLTLYNFFNAAFVGPGAMPRGWVPANPKEKQYLQYCSFCEGYKGPRSHHCRKCGRCVMKMDHHCPWINNCVGHRNHAYFTYFLFFAPCGCVHALCIIIPTLYRVVNKHYYFALGSGPVISMGVYSFLLSMFSVGLAIGVVVAVGGLGFIQVKTILRNETGIENWIREKAEYRDREEDEDEEFVYPYHLGLWQNWKMAFGFEPYEDLDGIWWPVVDGCNQFTLTIEQIKQKKEKKERSVVYSCKEQYAGSICPITKGPRVVCCIPFTDEPRIALSLGDKILVSRWKKHWLYGEKLDENLHVFRGPKRIRGWFPRRCAIEQFGEEGADGDGNHIETEKDPTEDAEDKKTL